MKKQYLIILNGWGMSKCIWENVKDSLSEMFNLIFVDWDNIGDIRCFKDRVLQIMHERKLAKVNLLGWSLGGLVATELAVQLQNMVDSLILVSSTSCFVMNKKNDYLEGWPSLIVKNMKKALINDKEKVLENFYELMFSDKEKGLLYLEKFKKMLSEYSTNYGNTNEEDNTPKIEDLQIGLDYLINMDMREELNKIRCRTLLIHGVKDRVCPIGAATYALDKIGKESKLCKVYDAGHVIFFTNPQIFTDSIREFYL